MPIENISITGPSRKRSSSDPGDQLRHAKRLAAGRTAERTLISKLEILEPASPFHSVESGVDSRYPGVVGEEQDEAARWKDIVGRWQGEVAWLHAEITTLDEQLGDAKVLRMKLESDLERCRLLQVSSKSQIAEQKQEKKALQQRITELRRTQVTMYKEIEDLRQQRDRSRYDIENMVRRLVARENTIIDLQRDYEEVQPSQRELQTALQEVHVAKDEVKRLQHDKIEQDIIARALASLNKEWFHVAFASSQYKATDDSVARTEALYDTTTAAVTQLIKSQMRDIEAGVNRIKDAYLEDNMCKLCTEDEWFQKIREGKATTDAEMEGKESVVVGSCGHKMCPGCADKLSRMREARCPICRVNR